MVTCRTYNLHGYLAKDKQSQDDVSPADPDSKRQFGKGPSAQGANIPRLFVLLIG